MKTSIFNKVRNYILPSPLGEGLGVRLLAGRLSLVFLILHSFFISLSAQTVTGTVTELFGGQREPVMGANVVLVNQQNRYVKGAVTDINGQYHLQVPKDEIGRAHV